MNNQTLLSPKGQIGNIMTYSSQTIAEDPTSLDEAYVCEHIGELEGALDETLSNFSEIQDFNDGFGSMVAIDEAYTHIQHAMNLLSGVRGEKVTVEVAGEKHTGVYKRAAQLIRVTYDRRSIECPIGHASEWTVAERLLKQLLVAAPLVPEAVQ